jgi:hypothetical protein
MNYDPNLTLCGRTATQTVKLRFQMWESTTERTVTIGGNCTGLTVMRSAVGKVYDDLVESLPEDEPAEITLVNRDGDTLICEDEEDQGEDWLADMCVSIEIVEIQGDTTA